MADLIVVRNIKKSLGLLKKKSSKAKKKKKS